MKSPFERVVLEAEGQRVTYTFDAFLQLPLHQRVQYLMDRTTEFYDGDDLLDRRVVLRALMKTG